MTNFRDYKTASRFSFAINAGWSARLDGKGATSMGAAKTNDPDLELAAFAYGWTRCDEAEKEREKRKKELEWDKFWAGVPGAAA